MNINDIESSIEGLEQEAEQTAQEKAELQSRETSVLKAIEQLQEDVKMQVALEKNKESIQQEKQALDEKVEDYKAQISELESDIQKLVDEKSKSSSILEQLEAMGEDVTSSLQLLEERQKLIELCQEKLLEIIEKLGLSSSAFGEASVTSGKQNAGSPSNINPPTDPNESNRYQIRPPSGTAATKDHILGPAYSASAQRAYDRICAFEPKITDDICSIANDLGCEMTGLPFSIKTASSVADKIERKRKSGASDEAIVNSMGDIIRYTALGNHAELVSVTRKFIDGFESKGYTVMRIENKYLNAASAYKGIHLDILSPNGQRFEFQIHSPESIKVKAIPHKDIGRAKDVL